MTVADSMTSVELRCVINNLRRLLTKRQQRRPTWALVSDLFGVGSTTAHVMCKRAGFDPDSGDCANLRNAGDHS